MSEDLVEVERPYDREAIAAFFREIADAFDAGRPVAVGGVDGENVVEFDPPERALVELELEVERPEESDAGGQSEVEFEIELEWTGSVSEQAEAAATDADVRVRTDPEPLEDAIPIATLRDEPGEAESLDPTGEEDEPESDGGRQLVAASGRTSAEDETKGDSNGTEATDESAGTEATDESAGTEDTEEPAGDSATDESGQESDPTTSPVADRQSRFEVYRDRAGEYCWRLVHWNGNVIADGGEGYTSRQNAVNGLQSVIENAPEATIEHRD